MQCARQDTSSGKAKGIVCLLRGMPRSITSRMPFLRTHDIYANAFPRPQMSSATRTRRGARSDQHPPAATYYPIPYSRVSLLPTSRSKGNTWEASGVKVKGGPTSLPLRRGNGTAAVTALPSLRCSALRTLCCGYLRAPLSLSPSHLPPPGLCAIAPAGARLVGQREKKVWKRRRKIAAAYRSLPSF